MRLIFIRLGFIFLCGIVGFQIGKTLAFYGELSGPLGSIFGGSIALVVVILELFMRRITVRGLSAAVFGLAFGLIMSKLVYEAVFLIPLHPALKDVFRVGIIFVFSYLGMIMAIRGRDEFNLIIPYVRFQRQDQSQNIIILDTSVIIDGRISDIAKTKFLEGRYIIPRFILKELHVVADSADALKRNRGRRGLDVLHNIQKMQHIDVKINEDDFPDIKETDDKLVKLAKVLGGKIFTNDYNLNKVAELEGVNVLNINELANALKPIVMPGELMTIRIIKEGKEHSQGIAYLDDGTMIVVEDAKNLIGQTRDVMVTSVLQTAAGRMIFAKLGGK